MKHRYIVAPREMAQAALWEPALAPVTIVQSISVAQCDDVSSVWVHTGLDDWQAMTRAYTAQGLAVVVITPMPNNRETLAALQAGAKGYCHVFSGPDLLRQVAMVVENGGLWVGDSLVRMLTQLVTAGGQGAYAMPDSLSEREQAVARRVVTGLANKQIARELSITERTVKAHISSIFRKMEVRDRLQLVLKITGQSTV